MKPPAATSRRPVNLMSDSGKDAARTPVPLSTVRANTPVRIVRAEGGRGLLARLTAMGLRPGVRVVVLNTGGPGPLVVAAGNLRFGIGRGMAARILVVPEKG